MIKNKKKQAFQEIDLYVMIIHFYKKKFFIIAFAILCGLTAYLYAVSASKIFLTQIKIQKVNSYEFLQYTNNTLPMSILSEPQKNEQSKINEVIVFDNIDLNVNELALIYNETMHTNLESLDLFIQFIEMNKNNVHIKLYLEKKGINNQEFFSKFRVRKSNKNEEKNIYYFNFPEFINGNQIFIDYVNFVKKKTDHFIKNLLQNFYSLRVKYLNQVMQLNNISKDNSFRSYPNKYIIFLKSNYEEMLNDIENFQMDYNPIIESKVPPIKISASSVLNFIKAFIFGFLISSLIAVLGYLKKIF